MTSADAGAAGSGAGGACAADASAGGAGAGGAGAGDAGAGGAGAAASSRAGRFADGILTLLAIGGSLCIVLVLAAVVFHVSIIMFKTGSMTPTIPAGSIALVQEVPADAVAVGDVVTVDRPGVLPVTHRVTSVAQDAAAETSSNAHARTLTLKGDANRAEDPAPYTVDSVKRVIVAIPGIAPLIAQASNPVVLGSTTLVMTGVVTWAFWPRRGRTRPVGARSGGIAVIAGLVALAVPLAPPPTETLAAWTDPVTASAPFTSRVVPAPTITGCSAANVLLVGGRVTITWTLPTGYTTSDIAYLLSSNGQASGVQVVPLSSSVATTGPATGGVYTTTFQGALLSNLLGGQIVVGLRTVDASSWTSADRIARATVPALVGPGSCTVL
jgi:signal peptidase I